MGTAILTARKAATVIASAAASRRETMNTTPSGRRQAPAQLNAPLDKRLVSSFPCYTIHGWCRLLIGCYIWPWILTYCLYWLSVIRAVLSLKWLHQTGEAGLAGWFWKVVNAKTFMADTLPDVSQMNHSLDISLSSFFIHWQWKEHHFLYTAPLPSNRRHRSNDNCLEGKREIMRSVLCSIVCSSCAQCNAHT